MNSYMKLLIAAIVGLMFFQGLYLFWASFPNWNPVHSYLLNCCAGEPWLRNAIFLQDLIINCLLCLLPVWLLVKINHQSIFVVVLAAVVPNFILHNYHLFWPKLYEGNISIFFGGWFTELLLLPIVAVTLYMVRSRVT